MKKKKKTFFLFHFPLVPVTWLICCHNFLCCLWFRPLDAGRNYFLSSAIIDALRMYIGWRRVAEDVCHLDFSSADDVQLVSSVLELS